LGKYLKTLSGKLIVVGKRGLIGEDMENIFDFSAVPSKKGRIEKFFPKE
jgi:hypothetical protein